jgi:hypothetical protein
MVLTPEQRALVAHHAEARRDARLAVLVNPSAIVSDGVPMDPNLSRLAAYLILYPQEQTQRRALVFWRQNFSQP